MQVRAVGDDGLKLGVDIDLLTLTHYDARVPSIDGPFLREQREMQGWKPGDFAREVGISPQYLADIELKRRMLKRRPDLIKAMADVLHLPVTKLYRDEVPA